MPAPDVSSRDRDILAHIAEYCGDIEVSLGEINYIYVTLFEKPYSSECHCHVHSASW